MPAIANYSDSKKTQLTKLHLWPSESCNADDAKHTQKIETRKQMFTAILRVTNPSQLCALEFEESHE